MEQEELFDLDQIEIKGGDSLAKAAPILKKKKKN